MRCNRWISICALLAACTSTPTVDTTAIETMPAPVSTTGSRPPTTAPVLEPTDFRSVADEITRSLLVMQPELVTDLGAGEVIGFDANHLLSDLSPRGRQELVTAAADGLAALDGYAITALDAEEQLSAEILRWYLEDIVTMAQYAGLENPVNYITGVHAGFAEFMADVHPINSEQDAEDYVDRLIGFRLQVMDLIDAVERMGESDLVPSERSLGIARWQIGNFLGDGDAESHPMVVDFKDRVAALVGEDQRWAAGIGARSEAAVRNLFPVMEDLDAAVARLDGLSDQAPGLVHLPGGEEYYAAVLRHHLGIDMSPQGVHEAGLEQVERLRIELTGALGDLGYAAEQDFASAMRQAKSDAGAMPTTSEPQRAAVLEMTQQTVAEAARAFEDLFTLKPAAEVQVMRPRPGREGGSGAYYRSPPLDGSRPGIYYLSLGGLEFGLLTMDTTTYHEGIPGHHFQLSVQRESQHLPLHQRAFDFTGYAEGWALYAEWLAANEGLYEDDPLGNVGRLRMELLRAARMVVDTGIHWAGWSRDQALGYMTELGFGTDRATAEVDRYIVWPGQAPAYLVGMLEIKRLADRASAELGEDYDIVGFHDAVLSHGSVPLELLDEVVDLWIAEVRG